MAPSRILLSMKWGTLYRADYVNVLYNAAREQIRGPFRFVCLTDDATGFVPGIEALPIPDIGCTPEMWRHGAWPKLSVFLKDLHGLAGRALFIDLDSVICGPLDPFFDHPAPIVGLDCGDNWFPRVADPKAPRLLGTGVFAFDLAGQTQIIERFQKDPQTAFRECDLEQKWVERTAHSLDYWPPGWVISFKRWLRRPIGVDLFLAPKAPPPDTGVLAFHGIPRPADLLRPGRNFWDRLPHMGHGQVSWMHDYWLRHGGRLS